VLATQQTRVTTRQSSALIDDAPESADFAFEHAARTTIPGKAALAAYP
jgi:hypothetical protein